MKKLIITLVTLCVAFTAHAQFYVGGGFGLVTNADTRSSTFNFSPELGYNLSDTFAVGGALGYITNRTGDYTHSYFSIRPYVRYTFAEVGPLNFFIDGAIELTTYRGGDGSWEIGVYPGVALPLNDRFSLVAHIGELSFNSGSTFTLALDNTLSAGLYYHF